MLIPTLHSNMCVLENINNKEEKKKGGGGKREGV